MSLYSALTKQAGFDFIQQGQKLVFSTVINIIAINLIPRDNYALYGIAAGYFVFLNWIAFTPETILVQKYEQIRKNGWQEYLSTISMFSWLRTAFIMLTAILLASVVSLIKFTPGLTPIIILYALYQALTINSSSLQFVLKMEFRQKQITTTSTLLSFVKVLALVLLFYIPSSAMYLCLLSVLTIAEIIIWLHILQKSYNFSIIYSIKQTLSRSKNYLYQFSLWQQISGNFTKIIYEVDTFFLSLVGVNLVAIGNYTIALQIANLSFILPSLLQSNLTLGLSRITDKQKVTKITSLYLRVSLYLALLQLFGFVLFGKWYIYLYSRSFVDEIALYSLIIFIGTTILNTCRPLISLSTSKLDIKKLLLFSIVPTTVFAIITYYISAIKFGIIGVAYANIFIYLFWVITMVWFIKNSGYSLSYHPLPTQDEIKTIKSILRRQTP